MFPYFGTFVLISAITFGVTLMGMMARRQEPIIASSIQVQAPVQAPATIDEQPATEIIIVKDISDVICDCLAEKDCKTLAQVNNETKFCQSEDDTERKICCPIDFNSNSVNYNVSNRVGPYYEDNANSPTDSEALSDYENFVTEGTTEFPDSTINPDYTNDENLISPRAYATGDKEGQSQTAFSYEKHKNFHLIPQWEKCGLPTVNLFTPGTRKARIVGGEKVDVKEFPWTARLGFVHKTGSNDSVVVYKCAATVLNQKYVVGAAHCIANFGNPQEILVQSVNEGNVTLPIDQVIVHPSYNKTQKLNDIVLIRLGVSLNKSIELTPICLPFFAEYGIDVLSLHKNMDYVLGWGVHTWNSTKLSDSLKMLIVPTISNRVCNKMYGNYFRVMDSQICAGGVVGQDTCQGDSGGPLATTYDNSNLSKGPVHVQIGITSFGAKLCGKGVPGVYTKISTYLQWLLDSIQP